VENALPQLQEQLAQAGISLGQTSVSDQPSPQQDMPQNAPARDVPPLVADRSAPRAMQASSLAAPVRNPHALIDTFA